MVLQQATSSGGWLLSKPSWTCAVVIATLFLLSSPNGSYSMPAEEEDPQTITLDDYLPSMGEKLNVRITAHYLIEPWDGESEPESSPFEYVEVPMDRNVATVDEFIREIKKKMPDVDVVVVVDETDKECKVLHLIDKKLGDKAKVLEQKIDMQWTGAPSYLAEELLKRGVPGIEPPLGGDLREGMVADYKTKMKVDAKQKSVRDVFTHSMNLKEYGWLVWVAKTQRHETKDKWVTWVKFYGPVSR